jgi:hypothetical protein
MYTKCLHSNSQSSSNHSETKVPVLCHFLPPEQKFAGYQNCVSSDILAMYINQYWYTVHPKLKQKGE